MLTQNKKLMARLNKVLTAEGKRWLAKWKLTDAQLTGFLEATAYSTDDSLAYNCGATVISTEENTSLWWVLGTMVGYARGGNNRYDQATLFIATFNEHQQSTIPIYRKAGFRGPATWVLNPNSGNKICGLIAILNPAYVKRAPDDWDEAARVVW